jgi:hypothetical protein
MCPALQMQTEPLSVYRQSLLAGSQSYAEWLRAQQAATDETKVLAPAASAAAPEHALSQLHLEVSHRHATL